MNEMSSYLISITIIIFHNFSYHFSQSIISSLILLLELTCVGKPIAFHATLSTIASTVMIPTCF